MTTTTLARRYRGCEITEATTPWVGSAWPNSTSGWVATCPCGWTTRQGYQSTLREYITAHKFRAANAIGCPL